ncbi:MAG: hypothetical protein ACPGWR_12090 [Ardenticatenaceae bacterium]
MWGLVSFMAALLAFLILMLVIMLIVTNMSDLSEWISKRFQDKSTQNELETRLKALENRVDQIEAKIS